MTEPLSDEDPDAELDTDVDDEADEDEDDAETCAPATGGVAGAGAAEDDAACVRPRPLPETRGGNARLFAKLLALSRSAPWRLVERACSSASSSSSFFTPNGGVSIRCANKTRSGGHCSISVDIAKCTRCRWHDLAFGCILWAPTHVRFV